jgi:hypothetical protein
LLEVVLNAKLSSEMELLEDDIFRFRRIKLNQYKTMDYVYSRVSNLILRPGEVAFKGMYLIDSSINTEDIIYDSPGLSRFLIDKTTFYYNSLDFSLINHTLFKFRFLQIPLYSIVNCNLPLVKYLYMNDGYESFKNGDGVYTKMVELAIEYNRLDVVKFLYSKGIYTSQDAYEDAISKGYSDIVKFLFNEDKIIDDLRHTHFADVHHEEYLETCDTQVEIAETNGYYELAYWLAQHL